MLYPKPKARWRLNLIPSRFSRARTTTKINPEQNGITVGKDIKLTASDNFQLGGYRSDPAGTAKGAVVVIQEIFGVNHHIRAVCDRVAAEGYVAVAPSIFDRIQPNFTSGYSPDEVAQARKFIANPDWPAMLRDTQAAIDSVKNSGPVGIMGFCLGGSIAYAAATKLSGLSAAIGYYGGAIIRFVDDKPKIPTQLHFGEKDAGIPLSDVETIKAKRPEVEVHIYPGAQHGFHCDERASYDKASADIAWPRSMALLAKHLKK
jgi:carboxymethylenebutenolidase